MASNTSKQFDILQNLVYGNNADEEERKISQFELSLLQYMFDHHVPLRETLEYFLLSNGIDTSSVFAITDFMEEKTGSLNKTWYFTQVYIGNFPDVMIVPKKGLN